ncbi:endonuclease/exonuclease/phosphatase family metal-dependent hydrolase [Roseimicrobium gellanilyticum]|uniref:Endonuclease/exonuclease/phosphatase family metal-dependent hydrolase n=1 Tax=Roseimicrobium gellanilyticum TaxID=748857 RepID=A0A366HWN9_9BACT|nr:endonuclease/exonuclease/phosphatase family protein [Roseimicrobium gellanilyticum]RBP48109.1 endonuclease/exonuclease/phosphatase family metal-dependent hydrolase [Roseimicrobium gellanilyticum]
MPKENKPLSTILLKLARRASQVLSLLAVAFTVGMWLFLNFVGYHNPASAFLLFLPAWLWSIPVWLALPLALLFDPKKSGILTLVVGLLYLGPLLGWQGSASPPGDAEHSADVLRVMTYNRGQAQKTSLQPFKLEHQPDVLALQDAGRRLASYQNADGYREFTHVDGVGEFTLLSKHPIVRKDLLIYVQNGDTSRQVPVAARFEIEMATRRVAIYSVHLPTPRPMLESERWGGFLWGILGLPGTDLARKRHSRQAYWDGKLSLATQLAETVAKESLPCIVVGDFNTPSMGTVYRAFVRSLQDSHQVAGSGYGYTFPGVTRNPVAFQQPWLRLDYVFADKRHWKIISHVTEPDRASQHRAVFAQLAFSP